MNLSHEYWIFRNSFPFFCHPNDTVFTQGNMVRFYIYRAYIYIYIYIYRGRRVIGISGSLIWSKTQTELIFNPCGEFRWSPEGPVSQIHSPHLHVGDPGIFSDLLRYVQMPKREWGAESNGKLQHLSAALVPEFVVEDLPSTELHPRFLRLQWMDLPLGRTLWRWIKAGIIIIQK